MGYFEDVTEELSLSVCVMTPVKGFSKDDKRCGCADAEVVTVAASEPLTA